MARLREALHPATSKQGDAAKAVVTRPVFGPDGKLRIPEGSRVVGEVVKARQAGFWHRNGKLHYLFRRIEAPEQDARSDTGEEPEDAVPFPGAGGGGGVRVDRDGGGAGGAEFGVRVGVRRGGVWRVDDDCGEGAGDCAAGEHTATVESEGAGDGTGTLKKNLRAGIASGQVAWRVRRGVELRAESDQKIGKIRQ